MTLFHMLSAGLTSCSCDQKLPVCAGLPHCWRHLRDICRVPKKVQQRCQRKLHSLGTSHLCQRTRWHKASHSTICLPDEGSWLAAQAHWCAFLYSTCTSTLQLTASQSVQCQGKQPFTVIQSLSDMKLQEAGRRVSDCTESTCLNYSASKEHIK